MSTRRPLADGPELLADHAVIGPLHGEPLADRPLDGPVGLRHRREVGFGLDDQIDGPEPRPGDGVGRVGQLEGEGEVGVGPEVRTCGPVPAP
jgi:hypothetical protein